jgi:hypothetical protein
MISDDNTTESTKEKLIIETRLCYSLANLIDVMLAKLQQWTVDEVKTGLGYHRLLILVTYFKRLEGR